MTAIQLCRDWEGNWEAKQMPESAICLRLRRPLFRYLALRRRYENLETFWNVFFSHMCMIQVRTRNVYTTHCMHTNGSTSEGTHISMMVCLSELSAAHSVYYLDVYAEDSRVGHYRHPPKSCRQSVELNPADGLRNQAPPCGLTRNPRPCGPQ